MYLLAVVEFNAVPADNVSAELVLSVNEAHSLGDDPCAESLNVKLFVDRSAGAEGTAFMVHVRVSSSSWKNVSGVPYARNLVVKDPADTPVKFLVRVVPTLPAVDPSSAIDTKELESLK